MAVSQHTGDQFASGIHNDHHRQQSQFYSPNWSQGQVNNSGFQHFYLDPYSRAPHEKESQAKDAADARRTYYKSFGQLEIHLHKYLDRYHHLYKDQRRYKEASEISGITIDAEVKRLGLVDEKSRIEMLSATLIAHYSRFSLSDDKIAAIRDLEDWREYLFAHRFDDRCPRPSEIDYEEKKVFAANRSAEILWHEYKIYTGDPKAWAEKRNQLIHQDHLESMEAARSDDHYFKKQRHEPEHLLPERFEVPPRANTVVPHDKSSIITCSEEFRSPKIVLPAPTILNQAELPLPAQDNREIKVDVVWPHNDDALAMEVTQKTGGGLVQLDNMNATLLLGYQDARENEKARIREIFDDLQPGILIRKATPENMIAKAILDTGNHGPNVVSDRLVQQAGLGRHIKELSSEDVHDLTDANGNLFRLTGKIPLLWCFHNRGPKEQWRWTEFHVTGSSSIGIVFGVDHLITHGLLHQDGHPTIAPLLLNKPWGRKPRVGTQKHTEAHKRQLLDIQKAERIAKEIELEEDEKLFQLQKFPSPRTIILKSNSSDSAAHANPDPSDLGIKQNEKDSESFFKSVERNVGKSSSRKSSALVKQTKASSSDVRESSQSTPKANLKRFSGSSTRLPLALEQQSGPENTYSTVMVRPKSRNSRKGPKNTPAMDIERVTIPLPQGPKGAASQSSPETVETSPPILSTSHTSPLHSSRSVRLPPLPYGQGSPGASQSWTRGKPRGQSAPLGQSSTHADSKGSLATVLSCQSKSRPNTSTSRPPEAHKSGTTKDSQMNRPKTVQSNRPTSNDPRNSSSSCEQPQPPFARDRCLTNSSISTVGSTSGSETSTTITLRTSTATSDCSSVLGPSSPLVVIAQTSTQPQDALSKTGKPAQSITEAALDETTVINLIAPSKPTDVPLHLDSAEVNEGPEDVDSINDIIQKRGKDNETRRTQSAQVEENSKLAERVDLRERSHRKRHHSGGGRTERLGRHTTSASSSSSTLVHKQSDSKRGLNIFKGVSKKKAIVTKEDEGERRRDKRKN